MTVDGSFAPVLLVPIKPLAEAKSRLRESFDDAGRAELVRAMLCDTFAAIRGGYRGPVYIVTADETYDDVARGFDVPRLPDLGSDYNSAVAGAVRSEPVRAAGAAIVLPADLPRAAPEDIARAIEALRKSEVVLVAAEDGGTGLLGLRPPDAITPAFGLDSAEVHRLAAVRAGRRLAVLDCPSLARDVDTIADLACDPASFGAATRAFLAQHPIGEVRRGLPHGGR
jgi:2-phospho-L-lactate guanylyltransferase